MAVASDIRDHHARCGPHLARLRMVASREADEPPLPGLLDDVAQATSAILAEARAAGLATVAAVGYGRRSSVPGFLDVRLARLKTAAAEAVAAAAAGDATALRRHLRRFEVLTSAMWTVQQ